MSALKIPSRNSATTAPCGLLQIRSKSAKATADFTAEIPSGQSVFNIPDADRKYEFALNSHSCLVDGAADDIQKMYAELNLFSGEHIVRSDEPQVTQISC